MVNEVMKVEAEAEELVKFMFFAKNKKLSNEEICGGPIYGTVNIDGKKFVIYTTLSESDVSRYRENTIPAFL